MIFLGALASFFSALTWAVGSRRYSALSNQIHPLGINGQRALFVLPFFFVSFFGLFVWVSLPHHDSLLSIAGQFFSVLKPSSLEQPFWWFLGSMLGAYVFGDFCFLKATQSLGVPTALAIASSFPIWTEGLGSLVWGERPGPLKILGLTSAVVGVVTVILSQNKKPATNLQNQNHKLPVKGLVLAFMASLLWALNSFCVAGGSKSLKASLAQNWLGFNQIENLDPSMGQVLAITFLGNTLRMLIAFLLTLLVYGVLIRNKTAKSIDPPQLKARYWLTPKEWKTNGAVFFGESYFGSLFFFFGYSTAPLALSATLSSLAPVLTAVFEVYEKLKSPGPKQIDYKQLLGVLLVVIGCSLLSIAA